MPYTILKNSDGTYRVENKETGKVHAKSTSKANAEKQIIAMNMAEHGQPLDKSKKRKKSKGKGMMGKHKGSMPDRPPHEIMRDFMGH